MYFTKAIAILSLAAVSIAAPGNVAERNAPVNSCAQGSSSSCCTSQPQLVPKSTAAQYAPGGLLALALNLLPNLLSAVSVDAKCNNILTLVDLSNCASTPVCCLNDPTGSTNTAGLISILDNDNISVCPAISV